MFGLPALLSSLQPILVLKLCEEFTGSVQIHTVAIELVRFVRGIVNFILLLLFLLVLLLILFLLIFALGVLALRILALRVLTLGVLRVLVVLVLPQAVASLPACSTLTTTLPWLPWLHLIELGEQLAGTEES